MIDNENHFVLTPRPKKRVVKRNNKILFVFVLEFRYLKAKRRDRVMNTNKN